MENNDLATLEISNQFTINKDKYSCGINNIKLGRCEIEEQCGCLSDKISAVMHKLIDLSYCTYYRFASRNLYYRFDGQNDENVQSDYKAAMYRAISITIDLRYQIDIIHYDYSAFISDTDNCIVFTSSTNAANRLREITINRAYNYLRTHVLDYKHTESELNHRSTRLDQLGFFISNSVNLIEDIECGNTTKYRDPVRAGHYNLGLISKLLPGEEAENNSYVLSIDELIKLIDESRTQQYETAKE